MKYTMSPQMRMAIHEEVSRILYEQKQLYNNDQLENIMQDVKNWIIRTLPDVIEVSQEQWNWEQTHNRRKRKKRGGKSA